MKGQVAEMSLTRKMLKAMGIEEEKIDQIIEAHTETVDTLKERAAENEEAAKKLPEVQKELDSLKAKGDDGYKAKYEKEHADFEKYKADQNEKEEKAAKESAVKSYFESKNISGKNLEIAMRGCRDEIAAIKLKDGKIEDAAALDELVKGDYAGLVFTAGTAGANTANPPAGNGGKYTSKADIMKIKDPTARQKAIVENPELFGR